VEDSGVEPLTSCMPCTKLFFLLDPAYNDANAYAPKGDGIRSDFVVLRLSSLVFAELVVRFTSCVSGSSPVPTHFFGRD